MLADAKPAINIYFSTLTVSPKPSPKPSTSPSGKPTTTPPTPPKCERTAPYTSPGEHTVNNREWMTTCESYSQTERCRTDIWATIVVIEDGQFVRKSGWAFNNLTYLPYMTRESWRGNPLGDVAATADGAFSSAGRQWRTECDTPATGRGACRSYTMTTVYAATSKAGGSYTGGSPSRDVRPVQRVHRGHTMCQRSEAFHGRKVEVAEQGTGC